jgi:glutamate-1-semialdehyde 2,1-aminomutase
VHKPGLVGQVVDLTQNTVAVEFNDVPALEKALSAKDIACVITEPVLTNSCMVLPEPGFHKALRKLTRDTGTLLLIDETHTVSTGLGGYTKSHGLEPDIFVLGKPVAGGVSASIWGLSEEVAGRFLEMEKSREPGYSGLGTTLSANPMQFAAMRACLSEVMTKGNYAHMEKLAYQLERGLSKLITRRGLPWHAVRVGARVEFICAPGPLKNGAEAEAAHRPELERCIHLALLNRGSLIAPFHNMMLISPATSRKQVERLIENFAKVTKHLSR